MFADIRGPTEPKLTTVGEAGVSIWSVSSDAEKEFPKMEAGLRSAISLARRLRDPISELSRVPSAKLISWTISTRLAECKDSDFNERHSSGSSAFLNG